MAGMFLYDRQYATADSVFAFYSDGIDADVELHRGPVSEEKPHLPRGHECWCSPLKVNMEFLSGHSRRSLQALLDEFYAVH